MWIGPRSSAGDVWTSRAITRAGDILQTAFEQLSTMQRVNRASDDPAGLIALEEMSSDFRAMQQAHANAARASGMLRVADSGMSQVGELLRSINDHIVAAGNSGVMSDAERDARQMEVDAAVEAVGRIGGATTYGGRALLDGSGGFEVDGVNHDQISGVEVHQNVGGGTETLEIEVTQAAAAPELTFVEPDLAEAVTLALRTGQGTTTVEIAEGLSIEQAAEAINLQGAPVGVAATVEDENLVLTGAGVGSDAFLEIEVVEGDLAIPSQRATGTDVQATVDGQSFIGDGNTLHVHTATLQADMTLSPNFEGAVDPLTISGEATVFSFSPRAGELSQIGMPNISAVALGGASGRLSDLTTGGRLSLESGDLAASQQVVQDAQTTVLGYRARVGAFERYTIDSSQRVLEDTMTQAAGAISFYDTDFAAATSSLARGQILLQAGIQAAAMNNYNRRAAAELLGVASSFSSWRTW